MFIRPINRQSDDRGESVIGYIGATVVAVLVITGVAIWFHHLGWIFAKDSAQKQADIVKHGASGQTGALREANQNIAAVKDIDVQLAGMDPADPQVAALKGQRKFVVTQGCAAIERIDGDLPTSLSDFKKDECN